MKRFFVLTSLSMVCLFLAVACGGDGGGDDDTGVCTPEIAAGQLVISEFMADPNSKDAGQEWIELQNTSNQALCLNGVQIWVDEAHRPIASADSILLQAGEVFVVGDGELEFIDFSYGDMLKALPNTGGVIKITVGAEVIDQVAYGETDEPHAPKPSSAASLSLCGDAGKPASLTTVDDWMVAMDLYDDVNAGTPGQVNPACKCSPPEGYDSFQSAAPGDLLITEVFANTAGSDDKAREWFEVLVVADVPVNLSGLDILTKVGGDPRFSIPATSCLIGAPGDSLLLASTADPEKNGGLEPDLVYGTGFALANTGGYLALSAEGAIIAEADYGSPDDGVAIQFSQAEDRWCNAKIPFGDGEGLGTPGEANPACSVCLQGDTWVEFPPPAPGSIVLSEIFGNTPGAEDTDREWLEVMNTTEETIYLNGLEIWNDKEATKAKTTIDPVDGACVVLHAHSYGVLARNADPTKNGQLPADRILAEYTSLSITNSGGWLALKLGGVLINEVEYTNIADGAALQLDTGANQWCDALIPFGDEQGKGSPGAPNHGCGAGLCQEGEDLRPVVPLLPGDVVITEIFANTPGNEDSSLEWFEIRLKDSATGKDLNGLLFASESKTFGQVGQEDLTCLPATPGELVVARTDVAADNGGLPVVDLLAPSLDLKNDNGKIILSVGGTELDSVLYPPTTDGVALRLDPGYMTAVDNDNVDHWCDAMLPYGTAGGYGSPGTENPSCDAKLCIDDQGASVPVTWPEAGDLVITEVFANTVGNEDENKEWFEVYIPGTAGPFQLNGLGIFKQGGGGPSYTIVSDVCVTLEPSNTYVFCRNDNPAENGGVYDCIPYSGFQLTNTSGFLAIGQSGDLADMVPSYGAVKDGVAMQLDPAHYNATDNDSLDNWCDAQQPNTFGTDGGVGSPGQTNPSCPDN